MDSEAEIIAEKARKSISRFCYEECKSYCCRKGYLNLDKNNVDLVTQGRKNELEAKKRLSKINENNYSLYIGDYSSPCPSLKDHKCIIHKNPMRPLACKHFPLFLEKNIIKLSSRCLAVKQGMLYPYISRLLKLGYKLSKTNTFSDFDFEKVKLD